MWPALRRRVPSGQRRRTRGLSGADRPGGVTDGPGGRVGGGARARPGGGRVRRAENKRPADGSWQGSCWSASRPLASAIVRVSEPAGGKPDSQGRGRRAIPGSEAQDGRPERRGGGQRPPRRSGTCGPRQPPVFRWGFAARLVCRAEPRDRPWGRGWASGPGQPGSMSSPLRLPWKHAGLGRYSGCPRLPPLPGADPQVLLSRWGWLA